jgi:hypothetical protein
MFNEQIVGTITRFSGTTTPDKNGKSPVMVQCIAGRMPNRNVLSGTVAERAGFEVGKTYLMQVRQAGHDKEFGDDFNFIKVMELTKAADIVEASEKLGKPEIFDVNGSRPEGFKSSYTRKGDAVEGLRTKREREGLYTRAYPSTANDHSTAREVHRGTSVNSEQHTALNPEDLLNQTDEEGNQHARQRDDENQGSGRGFRRNQGS